MQPQKGKSECPKHAHLNSPRHSIQIVHNTIYTGSKTVRHMLSDTSVDLDSLMESFYSKDGEHKWLNFYYLTKLLIHAVLRRTCWSVIPTLNMRGSKRSLPHSFYFWLLLIQPISLYLCLPLPLPLPLSLSLSLSSSSLFLSLSLSPSFCHPMPQPLSLSLLETSMDHEYTLCIHIARDI